MSLHLKGRGYTITYENVVVGVTMKALRKRKIKKAAARRAKAVDKYQFDKAWRNIVVQADIVK